MPHKQAQTAIVNKAVAVVEARGCKWNLLHSDFPAALLDPQEARSVQVSLNMLEARWSTSGPVRDDWEQVSKCVRFVILNFAVLDWFPPKKVVQLNSFVGRSAILVLGRRFSDPEVDLPENETPVLRETYVVSELLRSWFRVECVQYDVAVVAKETSVVPSWPWNYFELFDSPNIYSWFLTNIFPLSSLVHAYL